MFAVNIGKQYFVHQILSLRAVGSAVSLWRMPELQPRFPLFTILADAREAARANESGQVSLIAAAIGVSTDEVKRRLEGRKGVRTH
jgi:hypothetical protein